MIKQGLLLSLAFFTCIFLVSANQPPIGQFEQITANGEVKGWAYDPDNVSMPIDMKFQVDEMNSIIVKADIPRFEGFSFSWSIPKSYRDGVEHSLDIFALDLEGASYPKLNANTLYFSLLPPQYKSCQIGNIVIIHAASRRFFAKEYVGSGDCFSQSEIRACSDGQLSGSYIYPTCFSGYAPCNFNDDIVEHSSSVTAYKSASVPYGSNCQFESRSCQNGVLSGNFAFSSCSIDPKPYVAPTEDTPADPEINCLELYVDERMNYPQCQAYLPGEEQAGEEETAQQQPEIYCSELSEDERSQYPECNVVFVNSEVEVILPDPSQAEIYSEDPRPVLIVRTTPKQSGKVQKQPEQQEVDEVPTQQVELIRIAQPITKKELLPKNEPKHPKEHKECNAYCTFMVFFSWLFG